jgi:hypothetical protein
MKPIVALAFLFAIAIIGYMIWRDAQNTEGIDRNLLKAVKGDKRMAKRLLQSARDRYPGKSDRWYVEKVIYDLERDGAGSGRGSRYRIDKRELRNNIFLIGGIIWLFNLVASTVSGLFRDRM